MKCYLADDLNGQSCYVYADSWDEAEKICKVERYELIGEYVSTQVWWGMPKWMDRLSEPSE